jgi:hypothetical protein
VNVLLEVLKFVSAVSTAAFGIFGIGSPKARGADGSLTKHGRRALAGLVVALIIAVASQMVDLVKTRRNAEAEAKRYEQLLRTSLYGSLSTRDALLDMWVDVPIDKLKIVDEKYAQRLSDALRNLETQCKKTETDSGGVGKDIRYECDKYEGLQAAAFDSSPNIYFKLGSTLLPSKSGEPLAQTFLDSITVFLKIGKFESELASWEREAGFGLSDFAAKAKYKFDGTNLEIVVRDFPLDPKYLADLILSSMVDFAGKQINLTTSTLSVQCVLMTKDLGRCKGWDDVLAHDVELWRFALKFPHRRDLIYDRIGQLVPFKEQTTPQQVKYFSYRFPDAVEEFLVANRLDINKN